MALQQDVLESGDGGAFINLRDSSGTGITSTLVSGKQALDVNVANSISVGVADKTTYTYGTTAFSPVGGVFQDTSPSLTAGQSGAFRLTSNRGVHVNLRDASGNELGAANASGVFVRPGDGTNTQGYTASNEAKVIDSNTALLLALMKPATGTITSVAGATSSTTLLASNSSRKGWSAQNVTNKIVYIAAASTAATGAFTVALQANSFYESLDDRVYTGIITMISPAGVSGNIMVTEYT